MEVRVSESYPPDNPGTPRGAEDRLIAAAPEDDMIRLADAELPEMKTIPLHVPPAEPDLRAGDAL